MNVFREKKPYTLDRIVRIGITVGVLWGSIKLFDYLSDILIPFIIAFLGAYILSPVVDIIQKKLKSRGLSVFTTLLLLLTILFLAGRVIVPLVGDEVSRMGELAKKFVTDTNLMERAKEQLPERLATFFDKGIVEILQDEEVKKYLQTDDAYSLLKEAGKKVLPGVWSIISGTASFVIWLIGLVVILLYLVFLMIDYNRLKGQWEYLIPPNYRKDVTGFIDDFSDGMHRYFRGQFAVASIVGILFATGFSIIGLPLGIILGLFIGLLNMVPYLQIVGMVPALLFAVMQTLETQVPLTQSVGLVLLIFATVQIIQDGILVPKIMGKVTGFSPAIILLSISVWGKLLGFLGLLIALPMTSLLHAYYNRYLKTLESEDDKEKSLKTES